MSDELAININIIFLDRRPERGHVDGDVDDAEKGKGKHGRYTADESRAIDLAKFCTMSARAPEICSRAREGFDCGGARSLDRVQIRSRMTRLTEIRIESIERHTSLWFLENPPGIADMLQVQPENALDNDVKDGEDGDKEGGQDHGALHKTSDHQNHDGQEQRKHP